MILLCFFHTCLLFFEIKIYSFNSSHFFSSLCKKIIYSNVAIGLTIATKLTAKTVFLNQLTLSTCLH